MMVEDKEGTPPKRQRLLYGGKQNDVYTLVDYDICNGSTVDLSLHLLGSKDSAYDDIFSPSHLSTEDFSDVVRQISVHSNSSVEPLEPPEALETMWYFEDAATDCYRPSEDDESNDGYSDFDAEEIIDEHIDDSKDILEGIIDFFTYC